MAVVEGAARTMAAALLRQARHERGWSQLQLVYAMRRVARARGRALPSDRSMKAMLSRWENGHQLPDEFNRVILCTALAIPADAVPSAADPSTRQR